MRVYRDADGGGTPRHPARRPTVEEDPMGDKTPKRPPKPKKPKTAAR